MALVLVTILMFGIMTGYLQSYYNPEDESNPPFAYFSLILTEFMFSSKYGFFMGMISTGLLEFTRHYEVEHKRDAKEDEKTINYEDDEEEEEKLSLIKMPELRNMNYRQL
jgi:hypothetical protein